MPQAVAYRYARALADVVLNAKKPMDARQVMSELQTFEQMTEVSPELRGVLLSPAVLASKKRAAIQRLGELAGLSRTVRNFLQLVVDKRRIAMLGEIIQAFEEVLDQRMGIVRAQVTSAGTLSGEQQNEVAASLAKLTGKQVRCQFSVDESLLGGLMARIGTTIYDGSVRGQLTALRGRLIGK